MKLYVVEHSKSDWDELASAAVWAADEQQAKELFATAALQFSYPPQKKVDLATLTVTEQVLTEARVVHEHVHYG